jgi:hypothetical protein
MTTEVVSYSKMDWNYNYEEGGWIKLDIYSPIQAELQDGQPDYNLHPLVI